MKESKQESSLNILELVDSLNEEAKALALSVAIYLAKSRTKDGGLNRLEPEFIKLVNGTVKVVQEIAVILNAARNEESLVYDVPSGKIARDQIELRLESLHKQCHKIIQDLSRAIDITG